MRDPIPRPLVPIAALLFLSGAGSLILEVVWSRLLRLVFGSTTLAISTILVAYMLGLGLGGLLGGRFAGRLRNGLRVYGWMEIAIAVYAFLVPSILELYPHLNRWFLGSLDFWAAALIRFVLALALLFLPTLFMGATLPILTGALVRSSDRVARQVGLLYGINTLGAVCGVVSAAFLLFPSIGVRWTNTCGAALDLLAGILVLRFASSGGMGLAPAGDAAAGAGSAAARNPAEARAGAADRSGAPAAAGGSRWSVPLLIYGAIGFTSLVYEVAWTRALTMIFGSSVYAFASMLAAFLLGIALGSLVSRRWLDRLRMPMRAYGLGVGALGILALATLVMFRYLPDLFLQFYTWFGLTGKTVVIASLALSVIAMLGPTFILGALFPLLSRALAGSGRQAGGVVGDIYFVNTAGSAAGAFLAGFVLIPFLGIRLTLAAAVAVNLLSASLVLLAQKEWRGPARSLAAAFLGAAAAAVLLWRPAWDMEAMTRGSYYQPKSDLAMGLPLVPMEGVAFDEMIYYRDGLNASVSIHRGRGGTNMRINGKTDASIGDMETQLLSGHIPMSFGGPAERVLVIGYASGVTTGSVTLYHPAEVDVVEIEPAVIEASRYFDSVNQKPLEKPNVRLIVDDGRTYLSYTKKKYSVIISEPSNPFISGCSNLFTREFFRSVRQALGPGGRFLQWVQLYGMDGDGLRALLAAVQAEFPHVYGFLYSSREVDLMLLAGSEPLRREQLPRIETLDAAIRDELACINIHSTEDFWSLLRLAPGDIQSLAREARAINTDDSMLVELRAPWVLHRPPEENHLLFRPFESGILPVADGGINALTPEELGRLAIACLEGRQQRAMAEAFLKESRRRGPAGSASVAEYLLARQGGKSDPEALHALLDQAATLSPNAFEVHYYRAQQRFNEQLAATSLASLDRALEIFPGDLRALKLRVRLLSILERPEEARAAAAVLLRTRMPINEPEILFEAAVVSAACKRFDEGIREMEEFLAARPFSQDGWTYLAAMHSAAGNAGEAARAQANAGKALQNETIFALRSIRREEKFGTRASVLQLLQLLLEQKPKHPELLHEWKQIEGREWPGPRTVPKPAPKPAPAPATQPPSVP